MTLVHAVALGRCLSLDTAVHCHHGRVQLSATVEAIDRPDTRFLELAAWPEGRFEPAWLGDVKGWSASVTDGDRGQLARWWVADQHLLSITATGPVAEVHRVARPWMDTVTFADRGAQRVPTHDDVSPPVLGGGPPSPPRSSPAAAR